ncbi:hypothetical protein BD413DRAFT_611916 [Trametes elegans]|nr:hypothetical protein BD413DRAFT_611916 [Trametes elegans]
MGAFYWIILAIILFVFLRQLPSHKLYVLTQDLQEAQTYFASLLEEGLIGGSYAEDYRKQLNELQKQADELQHIMKDIWPFSYRDFANIFRGVTSRCYKVRDDVEIFRNSIRRTGGYEKLRFDTYKMRATPARGYSTDASSSSSSSSSSETLATATFSPAPSNEATSFGNALPIACNPDTHRIPALRTRSAF